MFQTPELKIGEELHDLLFTDADCTPLQYPLLHRRYRRDKKNEKVNCPSCNPSVVSGSVEGKVGCPYCKGDGYLFDEVIIQGWMYLSNVRMARYSLEYPKQPGYMIDKEIKVITLPPIHIKEKDLVFRLKLDENNRIAVPVEKYNKYTCFYTERYTSNQSDSEFNVAVLRL